MIQKTVLGVSTKQPNQNNRIYDEDSLKEAIAEYKERIENKTTIVTLNDTYESPDIDLTKACALVDDIKLEEGNIVVEMHTLTGTPAGNILDDLNRLKVDYNINFKGVGTVSTQDDGTYKVEPSKIIGFSVTCP